MSATHDAVGLVAASLSLGALCWTLFLQAPLLSKRLGRDRFVPLMMALVRPLFRTVAAASVVLVVVSVAGAREPRLLVAALASLVLSWLGLAVVVPRALRAGGRTLGQELTAEDQHAAGRFLADGGGEASRWWHRALVLVTAGILAAQGTWLVFPRHGELARPPEHAAAHVRFMADAPTREGVRALRALVAQALAESPPDGASTGAQAKQAYAGIFTRCTMTGEGHEVLHAWLLPMGEMISDLTVAKGPATTQAQLERLRAQLDRWDELFE